jgi:hypothetical protein
LGAPSSFEAMAMQSSSWLLDDPYLFPRSEVHYWSVLLGIRFQQTPNGCRPNSPTAYQLNSLTAYQLGSS